MLHLPLKDRILKSSSSSPPTAIVGCRPDRYKVWTESKLYRAFEAVQNGMSIRRAAEAYGVPRTTLQDRISGRVPFGTKSGPAKYLSDEEEEELYKFITGCASVGYARSKQEIISMVRNAVAAKGNCDRVVTDGWWSSFKRRHGCLTLRTAEPVSYARAISSSSEVISNYYDLLEKTLSDNDLMDKPCQIYNMDETGMPLDPTPTKIVTVKGTKHPTCITTGNKTQLTVVGCCSADGRALPPMVIFDRKNLKPELTFGEFPGTLYGLSKNGWMDSELFALWFNYLFLPYAVPLRPLLLIMDGQSTHYQPSVIFKAAEEHVILFCLPPHTTHLTQPLDKGCFGPLKMAWRKQCKDFISRNPGRVVTRYDFSSLFGKVWEKSMTMTNVIAGFRCTGIYPFDRNALAPLSSSSVVSKRTSLSEKIGLNFIPLFTPARKDRSADCVVSSCFTGDIGTEDGANNPGNTSYDTEDSSQNSRSPTPLNVKQKLSFDGDTQLKRQTVLTRTLSTVSNIHIKYPAIDKNKTGRVLTSVENLKVIEEKEREKKEKLVKREALRIEREKKRKEKMEAAGKKKSVLKGKKQPINFLAGENTYFIGEHSGLETRL